MVVVRVLHRSKPQTWFRNIAKYSNCNSWRWQPIKNYSSRRFNPPRNSFGIAFDIDGVLIRGGQPFGRARDALYRLYKDPKKGELQVPFVFLTNGGGMTEAARATELTNQFEIHIHPTQVILGHTPFKSFASRYNTRRVLVVGKGSPETVLTEYGFPKVVRIESYAKEFDNIYPLYSHKFQIEPSSNRSDILMPANERQIAAVFICSDPLDWGHDIQVLCDVLRSGGLPGRISTKNPQPQLYFAADDFEYQGVFPIPRFGMGAFRATLQALYEKLTNRPLVFNSFGKPKCVAYILAGENLHKVAKTMYTQHGKVVLLPKDKSKEVHQELPKAGGDGVHSEEDCGLRTLYMIGDNPETDIAGAIAMGRPWFSILVRTGCFRGKGNHHIFPADKVVEDVYEAIEFIANKEGVKLP